MGNEQRRSVRFRSDNTSSSSMRDPFSPRLPLFYCFKKGAVSLINYPPNKSNYLGSPLYLILYYIHQRARTREGPVPTLHTLIALGDGFLHDNAGWFRTTDIGSLTIGFSSSDPTSSVFCFSDTADSNKTDLSENLCLYLYFLDSLCIRPLRGSVEYKCIMDVFTLSSLSAQVRAI